MAHRPTLKHENLLRKIEEKKARSRDTGSKQKRLRHWAKEYEARVDEQAKAELRSASSA